MITCASVQIQPPQWHGFYIYIWIPAFGSMIVHNMILYTRVSILIFTNDNLLKFSYLPLLILFPSCNSTQDKLL